MNAGKRFKNFCEAIPIIIAYPKYIMGESAKAPPPMASIKKPAPTESTIALFTLSQSAAASIRPKIRSGVLGHILRIGKNEHCAVPKIKAAIEKITILFAVSSFMLTRGA